MGEIQVPADKLWGAQTQRSLQNFKIGDTTMPREVIRAFATLKKAAALTNAELDKLDYRIAEQISVACNDITEGKLWGEFPLVVWQTGSGTQTNMNVNEVIANHVNKAGKCTKIHPNDDVNKSQSSNDTFPSAMHICAITVLNEQLYPAIDKLRETLHKLSIAYADTIKIGRTHLQDATPITFGQEVSAWVRMLDVSKEMIEATEKHLYELALGGTAVGTGLNAHPHFGELVANVIANETGYPFVSAPNKFHSLTSQDAIVASHGAIKALAANLMKIANDVRWLASGPRCGIGEIKIPENEPGSSIMPGKVNPTQSEALTMVVCQVMGNDAAIGFGASQGNFQLNVFLPVIISNFLNSVRLLSDAMTSFNDNCAVGIIADEDKMLHNLNNSLMLVTALNQYIGYEQAAKIAKFAYINHLTLKQAGVQLDIITGEDFDRYVDPRKMV